MQTRSEGTIKIHEGWESNNPKGVPITFREILETTLASFAKLGETASPQGFRVSAASRNYGVSEGTIVAMSKDIAASLGLVVTEQHGCVFFHKEAESNRDRADKPA